MFAINSAISAGLFYLTNKSGSGYLVENNSEIIKWIDTENNIEELRDFAYRAHVDRNRKQMWIGEQNTNLAILFILNAFLFGFFALHHLKNNSNKVNPHG